MNMVLVAGRINNIDTVVCSHATWLPWVKDRATKQFRSRKMDDAKRQKIHQSVRLRFGVNHHFNQNKFTERR